MKATPNEILQKAKEEVAKERGWHNVPDLLAYDAEKEQYVNHIALRCMELVQQEWETQNWISVDEKLPEIDEYVWITYTIKDSVYYEKARIESITETKNERIPSWVDGEWNRVTPLAWMAIIEFKPENK